MSVTSSRLRHQGLPGLQAQKWVNTEKISARTIVIGTTLAIVWPSISTTSRGKLDIAPHPIRNASDTFLCLRSGESETGRYSRDLWKQRNRNHHRIQAHLIPNLLCSTRARASRVWITVPQVLAT